MEIKKFQPVDHYVRATVYGGSWVWKTVFWWTAPKPIFASAENGLLSIVSTLWYSPDYVAINSVESLQELYKFLKDWSHDYQTLVIDSMTEINEMIKEKIEKKIWRPMQIKEWWELAKQVKWIIRAMRELPIHVILICQEKLSTDDEGHVITVKPMLNWKNADEIAYMMDIVAYMYINNRGERIITTSPSEKLVSKDRTWLLQSDVSLNFNDWVIAMQSMTTWKSEVVRSVPKQAPPKNEQVQTSTPPVETAPVEITKPATEKRIASSDKMTAMTTYWKYCDKANPWVDKKEMFAILVADRFNNKLIDELTEEEWKQLVQIAKEIDQDFDDVRARELTEEVKPGDAVYIDDAWWIQKTQPAQEQDTMNTVFDELPF